MPYQRACLHLKTILQMPKLNVFGFLCGSSQTAASPCGLSQSAASLLLVQGMEDKVPAVPAGIAVAGQQLRALALPAAVVHIARHLWKLRLIRKKRRRKPVRVAAASQGKLCISYPKWPRILPPKAIADLPPLLPCVPFNEVVACT